MFELNEAIVRQIMFAMENQNVHYVCDMLTGELVRADRLEAGELPSMPIDPEARYQDIPGWTSADGFLVMEQFAGQVHNEALRARLEEALHSGRGAFRRFKDTLGEGSSLRTEFSRFKNRRMHDAVVDWYNWLREIAGLELLELGHDEESDGLILADVEIERLQRVPATVISELDRQAMNEAMGYLPQVVAHGLQRRRRARMPDPGDARSIIYGAHTPLGELCGFLWEVYEILDDGSRLYTIESLYVLSEFRGLGIAGALLDTVIAAARAEHAAHIGMRLTGQCDHLARHLERAGFEPAVQQFYAIPDRS